MSRQENKVISVGSYLGDVADVQADPLNFSQEIQLSGITKSVGEVIFDPSLLSQLSVNKNKNAIPVHPELTQEELEKLLGRGKLNHIPVAYYTPVVIGEVVYTIFLPINNIRQFETTSIINSRYVDLVTVTPELVEIATKDKDTGYTVFHDYNSTNALFLVRDKVDNFRSKAAR